MRYEFAKFITEKAEIDDKIVLIVGDIGYGLFDEFKARYSSRFFNFGLCEQSMISAASGMALEGSVKPWVYTITPFLIERPFEQLKLDIDLQNVNVKLVGYADYPDQGPTHAEINAFQLMGMFENIKPFFPVGTWTTQNVLEKAYKLNGPAFISLKKARG